MAFYKVYGKWYHLEYSDYFEEVVKARSPQAALLRFARCLSSAKHFNDIEWECNKPEGVQTGLLDPQPAFWVGDDQIYQVRKITRVKPAEIECPTCKGVGKIQGYIAVEPAG